MSTIKDGGPAFPRAGAQVDVTRAGIFDRGDIGMTLRDYFAAKAMQGELASQTNKEFYDDSDADAEGLANWAYEMADAMLAAREAQP